MTYIKAGGKSYYVWSYRVGIGSPRDTGSMLYIATVDEKNPGVLTSDPVQLSRPLYGWENVRGTINNEGPYSFNANARSTPHHLQRPGRVCSPSGSTYMHEACTPQLCPLLRWEIARLPH